MVRHRGVVPITSQKLSRIPAYIRSGRGRKEFVMFSALIVMAGASTGIYAMALSELTHPGQMQPLLKAGTSIHITSLDQRLIGGTYHPEKYLGEIIPFSLSRSGALLGSWHSTGKSVMYVTGVNWVWAELPWPGAYGGSLNQTLPPGQYKLIYGGYAGDVITIADTIGISYYTPHSISSLNVHAGTVIHTHNSSVAYSFNITQTGTIVGSFRTTGAFTFSVSTISTGSGSIEGLGGGFSFGYTNSSTGTTNSGPLTTPLEPGSYVISFYGSHPFTVTGTIVVLNIIEWNYAT